MVDNINQRKEQDMTFSPMSEFTPGTIVKNKSNEMKGVVIDPMPPLEVTGPAGTVQVIHYGHTDMVSVHITKLNICGQDKAISDPAKCGTCVFFDGNEIGHSCERYGAIRVILLEETKHPYRHPLGPYPECQSGD